MTTITLHGLTWTARSPSLLGLVHPDGIVHLGYNGRGWVVGINNEWGITEWDSRDAAARAVADTLLLRSVGA